MKAAVTLRGDVFEAAERQARRMRISRSELYTDALLEYLARHAPDELTEIASRVCDELGGSPEPFAAAAARRALERGMW
ncbi:MAG TPA: hypothetical protein VMR74_05600 [Gammaproteobacteria bacterium]|nr:hypothetical protein [Gammaproteobacteria bacterium]